MDNEIRDLERRIAEGNTPLIANLHKAQIRAGIITPQNSYLNIDWTEEKIYASWHITSHYAKIDILEDLGAKHRHEYRDEIIEPQPNWQRPPSIQEIYSLLFANQRGYLQEDLIPLAEKILSDSRHIVTDTVLRVRYDKIHIYEHVFGFEINEIEDYGDEFDDTYITHSVSVVPFGDKYHSGETIFNSPFFISADPSEDESRPTRVIHNLNGLALDLREHLTTSSQLLNTEFYIPLTRDANYIVLLKEQRPLRDQDPVVVYCVKEKN